MTVVSRRQYLGVVTGVAAAVAGCVDRSGECLEQRRDISSVEAGGIISFIFNLDEQDRLFIDCEHDGFGARPSVTVIDPNGRTVLSDSRNAHIRRIVTAERAGEYEIAFENRARLLSGTWETRIVAYRGYCEIVP